jgi:hypothetical protein
LIFIEILRRSPSTALLLDDAADLSHVVFGQILTRMSAPTPASVRILFERTRPMQM